MVGIEQGREDRLLRFLRNDEPAWKTEDHPELAAGAASWVREIRSGVCQAVRENPAAPGSRVDGLDLPTGQRRHHRRHQ